MNLRLNFLTHCLLECITSANVGGWLVLGRMIKDSGWCIRVGWISQTPVTMRGWSCLYPDGWVFIDGGQENRRRGQGEIDVLSIGRQQTNYLQSLCYTSLIMTEITDSTIKPQSSSTNWSVKTGMTRCTSVIFSPNKILSTTGHAFHFGCSFTSCEYCTGHR